MDPTTTDNQFQLAFLDLAFGLITLFFNVITEVIFPAVAVPFFQNVIDVLQMIFAPFLPAS